MYDLPEVRRATDGLWAGIARHLRSEGVPDVPAALDRGADAETQWGDPALLLSQACGYPITHAFARALRVVATPCHAIAGCEQGDYFSVVVVRDDASVTQLSELRGEIAVINEWTSHSGMNALGALVAPLEGDGFFRDVVVSGSHVASLAMVARGEASVAAIDCVTHALLARWRPSALVGTRILTRTASAPALPFVTRASASEELVVRLRAALARAMHDDALSAVRDDLLLGGIAVLPEGAYDVIRELQSTHRLNRSAPTQLPTR
jgi:ABC-type phosphate/phosphonate transport system substrate-binding protein